MKTNPYSERLEILLNSSQIVAGGFLGEDNRSPGEIIETDRAMLIGLNVTKQELARRMAEITEAARKGLGLPVPFGRLTVTVDEARGWLVCPWPHPWKCRKITTTVRHNATGEQIRWSDLCIHLIGEHGFFQGKGTSFRIEPYRLVQMIFP